MSVITKAVKALAVTALIFSADVALAQTTPAAGTSGTASNPALGNLKKAGTASKTFNTSQTDPTIIVGNIIGYALSLLGIVFLVLTIYAGFLWMTAQGNEEQITKAKKMMTNAVIGIVIVGMAYMITIFITKNLSTDVLTKPIE